MMNFFPTRIRPPNVHKQERESEGKIGAKKDWVKRMRPKNRQQYPI